MGEPWTDAEVEMLRRAYTRGGVRAAVMELPHRTRAAIREMARVQGFRAPRAENNEAYNPFIWADIDPDEIGERARLLREGKL